MSTTFLFFIFIVLSAAIILTARKVSFYADHLGTITRISKGFIGLSLLAAITSLPELFTSLTAVLTIDEGPALAAGNIFGSNCFNITILFTAFFFYGIMPNIKTTQHLFSGIYILMFTLILLIKTLHPSFMEIGVVDLSMWLILFLFVFSIWTGKTRDAQTVSSMDQHETVHIRWFGLKFGVSVILIIMLSYLLTQAVDVLSIRLKLGHSFGGYLFLALATSLPELSTTFSSLKYDIDMSLGNILGSNIFNPMIIALLQVFMPHRPLLENFSLSNHLAMLLSLVLLSLMLGFIYYPKVISDSNLRLWRICLAGSIGLFIAGSYTVYITSIP